MVLSCFNATGSEQLLRLALPRLIKTWDYWMSTDESPNRQDLGASHGSDWMKSTEAHEASEASEEQHSGGQRRSSSSFGCSKAVLIAGPSGKVHRMSRYCADTEEPRPESYR